jgi:hypothetical protein
MSGWFRAIFLFTSFAPLYLLLCASLYAQGFRLWWVALLIAGLAICAFIFLEKRLTRKSVFRKKVVFESSLDESVFSYMLSYIPPLMIDDFSDMKKLVPVIGFYIVTVFLLFRSSVIYINPFFIALGYRVYIGRIHESGRSVVIITRDKAPIDGEVLNLYEVQSSRLYYAEQQ